MIVNADEIKRAADVASIIGRRIALSEGRYGDHLEGSCPFHASKSGRSFHVTPEKQSWYCWGCRIGGGAVDFVMKYESVDYPHALEIVASESGVAVQYSGGHDEKQADEGEEGPSRQDILAALEKACQHYQTNLWQNKEAMEYLAKRGLFKETVARWRLGYASDDAVAKTNDADVLLVAGVLKKSKDGERCYDPLAGRITIPLCDHMGRPVAFTGRLMAPSADRPKYLNTGETPVFKKGRCLFGWSQSKEILRRHPNAPLHIMEGQLKAVACIENGLAAVAPGGTAFTAEQAAMVRHLTSNVVWCPDPDEAGAKAVLSGAPVARSAGIDVAVGTLVIPDAVEVAVKDPDDLMAMGLPVRYDAEPLVDWLYHRIAVGPVRTADEAARMTQEILPIIDAHPLPAVRIIEKRRLSELSGIPESQLAAPSVRDLAARQTGGLQEPMAPRIDQSMPLERLLYAAVLQQGFMVDWKSMIPWCDLTSNQWMALASIGQVLGVASACRLSLADAIGIAAKPGLKEYMVYWLHVPEAATADIGKIAHDIAAGNRRKAAMYYASQGNYQYAAYLNH